MPLCQATSSRNSSPQNKKSRGGIKKEIVQRKVGFEFEISEWNTAIAIENDEATKTTDASATPPQVKHKPCEKGNVIAKFDNFELQSDEIGGGSDVEFVTDAFEENPNGYALMLSTAQQIVDIIASLDQQRNDASATLQLPCDQFSFPCELKEPNAVVTIRSPFKVYPQASAGIDLKKFPQLLQDFSENQEDSEKEKSRKELGRVELVDSKLHFDSFNNPYHSVKLSGMQFTVPIILDGLRYFKEMHPEYAPWEPSQQMIGFLALIHRYVREAEMGASTFPKIVFVMLSRTDFASMYRTLPKSEQHMFRQNHGKEWVEMVNCAFCNVDFEKFDQPLFKGIYQKFPNHPKKHALDVLTIRKWLEGFPNGIDYLTSKNFPDQKVSDEIESLGAYGSKMDLVGPKRCKAPILEFRKMKNLADFHDLPEWCDAVFKYVYAVNHSMDKKFKEDFDLPS
ncbi:hypothetical protein [Aureibacter tunicatorum]|uniref:Uncharacterized protein n=1 Tax=Aureibacter tunicatorum TaxID=866807 RepID=A0AAE3XIZ9_9BACT|nr:hypothetical protein [Aureibacter tunicatorum]MDR6237029.1 hypothetical protein [Aureibacter tunicatorum]BDD06021.1 hypothetical protein AUTU_35040 [Aureibacter tunicatorum]